MPVPSGRAPASAGCVRRSRPRSAWHRLATGSSATCRPAPRRRAPHRGRSACRPRARGSRHSRRAHGPPRQRRGPASARPGPAHGRCPTDPGCRTAFAPIGAAHRPARTPCANHPARPRPRSPDQTGPAAAATKLERCRGWTGPDASPARPPAFAPRGVAEGGLRPATMRPRPAARWPAAPTTRVRPAPRPPSRTGPRQQECERRRP